MHPLILTPPRHWSLCANNHYCVLTSIPAGLTCLPFLSPVSRPPMPLSHQAQSHNKHFQHINHTSTQTRTTKNAEKIQRNTFIDLLEQTPELHPATVPTPRELSNYLQRRLSWYNIASLVAVTVRQVNINSIYSCGINLRSGTAVAMTR